MASDHGIIGPDKPSFEVLLDDTFERLWEKKIQLSLHRLGELDVMLAGLEQELDDFLLREKKPVMNP